MTLTYTTHLKLAVPDFLTEPWHSEFAAAMDSIDRILYDAVLQQQANLWLNSTAYVIGNIVISPSNGSLYVCAVAHTSSASPTTFAQELIAHPTFWTIFSPSLATQAEAEAGVENTHYMSALRTKQAIAALTSQANLGVPNCGILSRTSATQLKYSPYYGNLIKINGVMYPIPAAGISGLGNTGVTINGTPGLNLGANTAYLVFAQIVAGVITGHFVTSMGFHRPSIAAGNEGVEVYFDTGSVTEQTLLSLIGIIRTDASGQFVNTPNQRFVRSWFNRSTVPLLNNYTANVVIPVSGGFAEISSVARLEWVNFANEAVFLDTGLPVFQASSLAASINISIGLDSGIPQDAWTVKVFTASEGVVTLPLAITLSPGEGYHFASPTANVATNAVTLFTSGAAGNRATFRGLVLPGSGS